MIKRLILIGRRWSSLKTAQAFYKLLRRHASRIALMCCLSPDVGVAFAFVPA